MMSETASVPPPDAADLSLCGLRVRTRFPLPDLLPWAGEDRAVDLSIRVGPVPDHLDDAIVSRPLMQVGADGRCRFALPSVAAYLVSADGREVVIAPAMGAHASEIRVFLLGTVLAIVCHRRGLLPLHACCVRVGETAIAFAGESGVGKSTLALGLRARGHDMLADDLTVVDFTRAGPPRALPSFPRLKLWRDALERAGCNPQGLEEVRPALGKYNLPLADSFCTEALPLAGLVLLDKDRRSPDGLRAVPAQQALEQVGAILYRPRLMLALHTQPQQMAQFLRLLGAVGGLWRLRRPETEAEWESMGAHLEMLASHGRRSGGA